VWSKLQATQAAYTIMLPTYLERSFQSLSHEELNLRETNISVMILTGEAMARPRAEYEQATGVPIRLEYGTSETGIIAQEVRPDRYEINRGGYFVEGNLQSKSSHCPATITSLYRRATPLVRYQPGDILATDSSKSQPSLSEFLAVTGRSRPTLKMPNGTSIHSAAIYHAMETCGEISRFQVRVSENLVINEISLIGASSRLESVIQSARETLAQAHPDLANVKMVFRDHPLRTQAGKSPVIFIRPSRS
jgi:phenylacetate-coenzyme A ligase PaaK-like adenylate-forming protein